MTDNRAVKWALLLSFPLAAQSLQVYSEFAKIDPSGRVVAPEHPREILSPAVARNAFTSFQVVVQVAKGTRFSLYIGQNPEDAAKVTLYRNGDRVDQPFEAEGVQVLWMDLWVARDAPVRRVKIEPQLNVGNDWIVYPMEVRVVDATVPDPLPNATVRSFLCGGKPEPAPAPALRVRNLQQDASLAAHSSKEELMKLLGPCTAPPPDNPESYLRI